MLKINKIIKWSTIKFNYKVYFLKLYNDSQSASLWRLFSADCFKETLLVEESFSPKKWIPISVELAWLRSVWLSNLKFQTERFSWKVCNDKHVHRRVHWDDEQTHGWSRAVMIYNSMRIIAADRYGGSLQRTIADHCGGSLRQIKATGAQNRLGRVRSVRTRRRLALLCDRSKWKHYLIIKNNETEVN